MARRPTRAPKSNKPTMAKAKSMVTKQRKTKAKKNMDTFFLKATSTGILIPSQGAIVANYLWWVCTLDPNTASSLPYTQNAEFNLYKLQYDKFRVNSVTIKVVPKANVLDVANGQNDAAFNTTGDGLIHTCIDRDGAAPTSIAVISRYPSYKKFDVKKPFSRTYSIRYPTGIWLDCQNPAGFSMVKELGLSGGISMYAENMFEDNYEFWNEPYATVTVQYNIVFQGKTSNSYTAVYDTNNDLIGMTINALPTVNPVPLSVVRNVRGTIADTLSPDELPANDVAVPDVFVP